MNKTTLLGSSLLLAFASANAEIKINDFLSFEGFVDMSYSHTDWDVDIDGESFSASDNSFAVDQVEIVWLFDFEQVTSQIDIEYEEAGDDLEIDQAFATYHFGNGGAITAGRYDSMLGFEAFEPTGLYQYSFAYTPPTISEGVIYESLGLEPFAFSIVPLPVTNQGVKYTYESETMFFGISLQDSVYNYSDRLGGGLDSDGDGGGYGAEAAFAFTPGNGLTFFIGAAYEDGDELESVPSVDESTSYVVNTYVTYEVDAWLFAAEFTYGESEFDATGMSSVDSESYSGLVMANFAYSERASVTGRVSLVDYELDGSLAEYEQIKYTIAHNYAFTDNLLLVAEISFTDGDIDTESSDEVEFEDLTAAVELLFTF